jgi:hypothetical protein
MIAPLLLLLLAAGAPKPQLIRITATDYAFQVPEHIKAGETIFTFENHGAVRHEMSLVMLNEHMPADSAIRGMLAGSPRRNFADGQGALVISAPNEAPGPGIWLNLEAGRTYLVVCTLRDTPQSPPHATMGMITSFRVE